MRFVRNAWVIGRLLLVCLALFALCSRDTWAATSSLFPSSSAAMIACQAAGPAAGTGPHPAVGGPQTCADLGFYLGTGYIRTSSDAEWNDYIYSASSCASPSTLQPDGSCSNPDAACAAVKARTEDPLDGLYLAPEDSRVFSGPVPGTTECRGGCSWGPKTGAAKVTVTAFGAVASSRTQYSFSGASCTATAGSPAPAASQVPVKPTAQVCTDPTGSQLTFCQRQDGKQCYTASTGKQICYDPGETGTKSDANVLQKREPGTVATPVPPTPPPGETLTQSGTPTPVTSTSVVNNVTTTSTTTTTNYTTGSGTNASGTESGETSSGTGGATTTTPGAAGSVAGGTCASNYTCANVSAVDCAILQETTKNRCASELSNLKTAMTGAEETAATAEGSGITGDAASNGLRTSTTYGADGLDTSTFLGASSCPTIPPLTIMGQTLAMDTSVVCTWMQLGGALVLLFGALGALRVLGAV